MYIPLSLCGMSMLQHVTDECRAHVVLCPGTHLRVRDIREYHTEKLRGGYWELHFGWKRGPCTNSSAGCAMIFSRRIKIHDLYRIVAALAGRGRDGETTQWTFQLDSAGAIPTAAHVEWGATTCTGESHPHDTGISFFLKKKHCRGKAEKYTDSGTGPQLGSGAEGVE